MMPIDPVRMLGQHVDVDVAGRTLRGRIVRAGVNGLLVRCGEELVTLRPDEVEDVRRVAATPVTGGPSAG